MPKPLVVAATALLALAAPLGAQQAASDTAGFVLRRGSDTLVVERFARTSSTLTGRILAQKRIPLTYAATLGPDGAIGRLEVRVLEPGAPEGAPPRQHMILAIRGDSIYPEADAGDAGGTGPIATARGAMVYHPQLPMIAFLEQIVRRARVIGGASVGIPVFLVSSGGRTIDARVEFRGADSAMVSLGTIQARLAVDASGRILGGRTENDQVIERVATVSDRALAVGAPDYSAPAGAPYTAEEVRITTRAGHVLAGTLTLPRNARGPVPAVVTITGSSPQDRDHNTPDGGRYRIFREVADTLGRRGVAVLRMDDRGVGQSTGDFDSATSADRADDIRAGLAYLRGRPEIDRARLALVGLSEGGMIAPMIAASDTTLAGIVLLNGPGSTGLEVLRYQGSYAVDHDPDVRPEERDSVFRARLGELEAELDREPWLRYFWTYDPLQTASRVRRAPVLIVHGATDRQVPPSDAEKLAGAFRRAGNRDVTVRMLADVNHVLLRDPDGSPRNYGSLPSLQLAPEAKSAIVGWLLERLD